MKLATLFSLAFLSFAPMTFAEDSQCACSKECMENCQKGNTKDCKCQDCDCSKSGSCGQGSCH